jgi:hypothetical protein
LSGNDEAILLGNDEAILLGSDGQKVDKQRGDGFPSAGLPRHSFVPEPYGRGASECRASSAGEVRLVKQSARVRDSSLVIVVLCFAFSPS